jgi:putative chitinase
VEITVQQLNETTGAGGHYRGRGLIQLTGKNNYNALATNVSMKLADMPAWLEPIDGAVHSACWVDPAEIDGLFDCINLGRKTAAIGDSHGYQDRLNRYQPVLPVLGG